MPPLRNRIEDITDLSKYFLKNYSDSLDEDLKVVTEDAMKLIKKNTGLISIMLANNEVGTIQPIREIIDNINSLNIPFHTDAVQAFGKIPIDVNSLRVDYLS